MTEYVKHFPKSVEECKNLLAGCEPIKVLGVRLCYDEGSILKHMEDKNVVLALGVDMHVIFIDLKSLDLLVTEPIQYLAETGITKLLRDPTVIKVMQDSKETRALIKHYFDIDSKNVLDCILAFRAMRPQLKTSFEGIHNYYGLHLKRFPYCKPSDITWTRRPLTPQTIDGAFIRITSMMKLASKTIADIETSDKWEAVKRFVDKPDYEWMCSLCAFPNYFKRDTCLNCQKTREILSGERGYRRYPFPQEQYRQDKGKENQQQEESEEDEDNNSDGGEDNNDNQQSGEDEAYAKKVSSLDHSNKKQEYNKYVKPGTLLLNVDPDKIERVTVGPMERRTVLNFANWIRHTFKRQSLDCTKLRMFYDLYDEEGKYVRKSGGVAAFVQLYPKIYSIRFHDRSHGGLVEIVALNASLKEDQEIYDSIVKLAQQAAMEKKLLLGGDGGKALHEDTAVVKNKTAVVEQHQQATPTNNNKPPYAMEGKSISPSMNQEKPMTVPPSANTRPVAPMMTAVVPTTTPTAQAATKATATTTPGENGGKRVDDNDTTWLLLDIDRICNSHGLQELFPLLVELGVKHGAKSKLSEVNFPAFIADLKIQGQLEVGKIQVIVKEIRNM